jgi:hypothetical protein
MADSNPVARAFELARDGTCHSVDAIRRQLERENCSNVAAHFEGISIKGQLQAIMRKGTSPGRQSDGHPEVKEG